MSQIKKYLKKIKLEDILAFAMITLGALMASFSVACILLPNDAIDSWSFFHLSSRAYSYWERDSE